ncbi:MAG: RNA pyrophosphohydrolase [Gammaproteobacteria bacterium]
MINSDGYRPNVGIILSNQQGKVLWARRIGQKAWQFPQGGMAENETPMQAMYREMAEEIGLQPGDVHIMGSTRDWLRYQLPHNLIRYRQNPLYIGQKQIWFLLRLLAGEDAVRLDSNSKPEFDRWRWVDYWEPLQEVVSFKREVYEQALRELAPLLSPTVTGAAIDLEVSQPAKTS